MMCSIFLNDCVVLTWMPSVAPEWSFFLARCHPSVTDEGGTVPLSLFYSLQNRQMRGRVVVTREERETHHTSRRDGNIFLIFPTNRSSPYRQEYMGIPHQRFCLWVQTPQGTNSKKVQYLKFCGAGTSWLSRCLCGKQSDSPSGRKTSLQLPSLAPWKGIKGNDRWLKNGPCHSTNKGWGEKFSPEPGPHFLSLLGHRWHSHFLHAHLTPPGTIAFLDTAIPAYQVITTPTSVGLRGQTAQVLLATGTGPITVVLAAPLGPFPFYLQ